ncbi:hypothetical protein KC19_2G089900 [Ceratodon purpureus]|uniref:Secreted protein n=1 Tax=Ceratodon purpureus TaxID=3225 RepID=A0A8T0IVM9_CERPU|nr:hypothetical protein KC19_2G089900 [Ceratodon purpureus]
MFSFRDLFLLFLSSLKFPLGIPHSKPVELSSSSCLFCNSFSSAIEASVSALHLCCSTLCDMLNKSE